MRESKVYGAVRGAGVVIAIDGRDYRLTTNVTTSEPSRERWVAYAVCGDTCTYEGDVIPFYALITWAFRPNVEAWDEGEYQHSGKMIGAHLANIADTVAAVPVQEWSRRHAHVEASRRHSIKLGRKYYRVGDRGVILACVHPAGVGNAPDKGEEKMTDKEAFLL